MNEIEHELVGIGLDYILKHFESLFPRMISTLATENKQVMVYSDQEALEYFKESNYVDCRISGFGLSEIQKEKPNLIFVDLDDRKVLDEVIALFHKEINGIPLVLDTGNGYAIIQPINIISFTNSTLHNKRITDVPKKFLQFAERYLTNNKCDSGNHPSLKSCMIRIPYTYNKKLLLNGKSRKNSQVKIHSEWDGTRPTINNLPFKRYLNKLELLFQQRQKRNFSNTNKIPYIEKLVQTKTTDGKKRICALILCPYLVNVKKLALQECENILTEYFDSMIPKGTISYQLKISYKNGILPYSLKNMKQNDSELYQILQDSGVLN